MELKNTTLVCEQLELYTRKHRNYRAAVLCHTDEESGKADLRREESLSLGASQIGYGTLQTPGSILTIGLHNIFLKSYTKQNYFWLRQIFHSYSLLESLNKHK